MWRPEGWRNLYTLSNQAKEKGYAIMPEDDWHYGFEVGADAMLEALRDGPHHIGRITLSDAQIMNLTLESPGVFVFIPDEEPK